MNTLNKEQIELVQSLVHDDVLAILNETEHYYVMVLDQPAALMLLEVPNYFIINKDTDKIEAHSASYPQAVQYSLYYEQLYSMNEEIENGNLIHDAPVGVKLN